MPSFKNIAGQVFGRFSVIKKSSKRGNSGQFYWVCKCSCGRIKDVATGALCGGTTRSCGCLHSEIARSLKNNLRHGHSVGGKQSKTHRCWTGILSRCLNPNRKKWASYGGRGIKVCKRWLVFENFLADMGESPEGLTIERINNDGDYEPGNCRWATNFEQSHNKQNNRIITFNGKTLCLQEWARVVGIKRETIARRLNAGWSVERALRTNP